MEIDVVGDKLMMERNYELKNQLRVALLEVMQPNVKYSCADLREAVCRTHPELEIEDRKFSTLIYRIRKDTPEITLEENLYMFNQEGEQNMEEHQNNQEDGWSLTGYVEGINRLITEAEDFCKRDITDTSLSTQQVVSIRASLELTRKLKKLMRDEEKNIAKALSEINVLNQMKK